MKPLRSQQGVSIIFEVILAAVVLGLVAMALYQSRTGKPAPSPSASPTASPTPTSGSVWSAYAGHNFSVSYPAGWSHSDATGTRTDLTLVYFGTDVAAGRDPLPGSAYFEVEAFHPGYKICDCSPTEYVAATTDLVHFLRALNGLLLANVFAKESQETATIAGHPAIRFTGQITTPWAFQVGSDIYAASSVQGKDVSVTTQNADFTRFLSSLQANK